MSSVSGFEHPSRLLATFGGRARKRFGQNFLCSERVVRKIVAAAVDAPGQRVLEVGPGLGVLTGALLAAEAEVTAVEIDRDLYGFLGERFEGCPSLHLHLGDAADTDWDGLLQGSGWVCAANLPYNVGTGILIDLLARPERFVRVVVMVQEEVARRVLAAPGDSARGSLSVYCQARAAVSRVVRVPPGAFHPPPKVRSAVVRFDLFDVDADRRHHLDRLETVCRAGFAQPRKMLRKGLRARFGRDAVEAALEASGVDGRLRPAVLDEPAWWALTDALIPKTPPSSMVSGMDEGVGVD